MEDALYAIRVYKGSTLFLKKTLLNNNFVGVRATDNDFILSAYEQNEIYGAGPLRNICGLTGLLDLNSAALNSSGGFSSAVPFSTSRGYAGWYINHLTALNFPSLAYSWRQNKLEYLIKGMEIYDTDFSMQANTLFGHIAPAAGYPDDVIGTGGIYFNDTGETRQVFSPPATGNTNALPISDFANCTVGIHIGTASIGTQLNINNSSIVNTQVGINIDQEAGSIIGADNGVPGNLFKGVVNNHTG